MKRNLSLIGLAILGASCGDAQNADFNANAADPNQQKTAQEVSKFPSYAFASKASLPLCSNALSNALAYIKDEKKFYTCESGSWSEIEIKGADGKDGANGVAGANGQNGTDNKIKASILCTGILENTTLFLTYRANLFSSGDVWAFGSISDSSTEIGGSAFYSSQQVGAATASVIFSRDELGTSNGGWWTLSLNRSTLVTSIRYKDSEATGGEINWTMTPDKCVSNSY